MATGIAKPGSPAPQPAREPRRNGRVVEYQQYIDTQLGRTRRRVKWVDLWTALTTLSVGFVAYLLVSAVIDHWIVPGGLGPIGRWMLLVGLVGGVAIQFATGIVPLVLRRVNPVYAAAAIEHGGRMKNTLINFLLLKRQPEGVPEGILDAIKEQAAVRLANVPDDAPVDRTALIRWCYVLATILVTAIGYAFLSPKDSFRSIRRVITPWAELAAPTRVRFESIEPGNVDRHRDDIVEVKVRAAGLRAADGVTLFYSATGNPADDVALPMQADGSRYLWKTVLPPGSEGLKQDLFYYVQAGDAASPRYRIRVLTTPVMNVRSVRYEYPAYTGLPPRTVEKQGDLKALEGTHVTLTTEANQPIAAAHVAFDQARSKDVELKPNGLEAVGGFDLTLKKDRETPVHASYVLRFSNIDGEENPKPAEYRIDVTADQPPELRVTEPNTPPEKEISLPIGVILRVTLAARDPDFQLGDLAVVVERNGGLIREERILSGTRYGEYSNTAVLSAEVLKLKAGDKFTFRGRAADNKAPKPNVVETVRYTVVVVPANGAQQPNAQNQNPPPNQQQQQPNNQPQPQNGAKQPNEQRPQPGNDQNPQPPQNGNPKPNAGQQGNPQNQNGGNPNQPNTGEKPNGQDGGAQGKREGEAPAEPQNGGPQKNGNEQKKNEEPIDPNVDPGKAFDELNKHFEQQDKQNEPQQKPEQPNEQNGGSPQQQQEGDGSKPQQQPGGGEKKNDQPGESKPGAGDQVQQPGNQANNGQSKPDGDQQGAGSEKKPGGEKSGNQPKDDGSTGGPGKQGNEPGEKQPGPDGGKAGDERQAGGADGVGRQGSEGGGEKKPGGQSNNQPAKNPGNEAAKPGGEQGTKSNDPSQQNPAERKPGENDGGREAGSKPGNEKTPGAENSAKQSNDPNDRTQQGSGSQQQQGPGNDKTGKQPGEGKPGEKPDGAKAGEAQDPGERRPGEKTNAGQPGVKRDTNSSDAGSGTQAGGDEAKPDDAAKPEDKGRRPGEQNPDGTQGKPSVNEKQPAGNTKNPGGNDGPAAKSEGSPKQDEQAKPRDKTGKTGSDNQNETGKSEEKSPGSNSKHESDSQGQTSGDRSGDGEEGAGQKANKKGTGAAGENTPGDQGGGAAQQEGDQATSDKGGDKVRGNDPSQGKPSERTGDGSKTDKGGDKAGGEQQGSSKNDDAANQGSGEQQTGAGQGGDKAGNRPGEKRPPKNNDQSNQGPNNGPGGGGNPEGNREPSPADVRTVAPPADEANLNYTRQVTDLTLDRLKQQLDKGDVDPELLKKFTSREALADFVKRWESMRQAARDPSPTAEPARKQFQETLKSLGLRPKASSQQGATGGGDDFRAVRGGTKSEPPAKWADHFRAYTTGVGQSEK